MDYDIILPNEENITVKLNHEKRNHASGGNLLNALFAHLGLRQEDEKYFGLMYCDKEDGRMDWLEENNLLKNLHKNKLSRFQFSVRYYPEHPELVLHNEKTQRLFRLQIKEKLLRGEWACNVETHAYLDGLIVQAELGNYNPKVHKSDYLKAINGVDICPPTRLNSERDMGELDYFRLVHYYFKRNIGISSKEANVQYLHRARELPLYGFIMHEAIDKNGNVDVIVGLREESMAVLDGHPADNCISPLIKTTLSWDMLKYCTQAKCKVKIGLTMEDGSVNEFIWKVKSKNCFRGAERLCNDIKAFRAMYCSRDENDFCTSKKEVKRARSFIRRQSSRERPITHRLNSVTTVLRSSLRRKTKREDSKMPKVLTVNKDVESCENLHESSTIVLVEPVK
eukprot:gene5089-5743_t